ncbi:PilZ domain-containing protein [Desulfobulbus elongatus]|uniref:PilZ domain-containing protein n=1 Tax=Desulfobulbus elongatus TaxID=53332 RepID=UPI000481B127|nr:PilZ domain-containing protein [Desulfobulbus elongatus]
MAPSERRRSRRIVFAGTAVLRYGDDGVLEAEVDTRNISLHGLSFETDVRLPLETPCAVEIRLSGVTSRMDVRAQGVIQRHDPAGMAVAFTQLDPDSFLHILNLVRLHEADESPAGQPPRPRT